MAIAHYGCWSLKGDPHGKFICQTADTRGVKTHDPELFSIMFQRFAKAVLGKTLELVRFLAKPLDEKYYKGCVEIFESLPDISRLPVDGEEDWISLFALGINGYTERHTDIRDIQGGLAGLFTVVVIPVSFGGDEKASTATDLGMLGANLCLPQLGVKVPYALGACAILRGSGLEHLVKDYSGPRFLVIGTNHEACRRHAMRKLRRLPALPDPPPRTYKRMKAGLPPDSQAHGEAAAEEEDEVEPLEGPCINVGADEERMSSGRTTAFMALPFCLPGASSGVAAMRRRLTRDIGRLRRVRGPNRFVGQGRTGRPPDTSPFGKWSLGQTSSK